MKILLSSPMEDGQTGLYLYNSLIQMGHSVAVFDQRKIMRENDHKTMLEEFVNAHTNLKPELTLIIKGIEFGAETVRRAKEAANTKMVGWIFDVTIGGLLVKDVLPYVEMLKELDTFYTIDADAVKELSELGVNAEWLSEGCHVQSHQPIIANSIQKRKYGADIVFIGSVGGIHPNRNKLLERLHKEGFDYKIYGDVLFEKGKEPVWVKDHHTGYSVINDYHSLVVQSSKIIIGIDGWTNRNKAYSARLYRTLCAGGFYLTTHTKGINDEFQEGTHLVTFKDEDELVSRILSYLKDGETRERIAKQGQQLVMDKHTFEHRLSYIIEKLK